MSRALVRRLVKLEAHNAPPASSRLVVIPWREWPVTPEAWEAARLAYPAGRMFVPSRMTEAEWEAAVPSMRESWEQTGRDR